MIKKECNIAVVGNMSAGKSTFINAILGKDILPSLNQATSNCPIYIYSKDKPNEDIAIIHFHDGNKKKLFNQSIQKELNEYAKKDSLVKDIKYKNVKKIDLYWKFYTFMNSSNKNINPFILIDTPGPNNTDEFGEKHHLSTKNIIFNEVSKVIYILDFKQIDANLEVTKDNLWGWIEKRKKMDSNFTVLFIINKIDEALKDNCKIPEVASSTNQTEYTKNLKKYWNFYEKKAISKIKKVAIDIGFNNPSIITLSSEYMKLNSMKNELSLDDEDKLHNFQKKFKTIFGKNWEKKFYKYIGSI